MSLSFQFPTINPNDVLQSIVETAIDGILLIDTSGNVLMVNSAVTKLFGYSPDELLGRNVSILMPSPHRQNHDGYIHNYRSTGIKKIIGIGREIEGLRKDGTQFPARLAVSEIIIGEEHYFTGIIQDLTDMKAVQMEILKLNHELEEMVNERTLELQEAVNLLLGTNQQLNQSIEKHKSYELALLATRDELHKSLEKEKELNLLKSRFVSMASHEFKTPLSSILSSAALISKYVTSEQVADRNRHVDRIKSSVNHLNNILMDFLSITRLEEGQFVPVISRFSLLSLLDELKAEAESLLKKDQQLICEHDFDDLEMKSDKNILRNILYNLVSNAVKYSDEGKRIICRISLDDAFFRIEYCDQGMGIPLEDQKHIGSRFFRASNVVNVPGTGLGLNIVLSYLHTLKVPYPLKANQEKAPLLPSLYLSVMKNKILIIEDNHDVRENLSELLTLSGYETRTAMNGKLGVEAAMTFIPDLILCDIMMPEMDGYAVLRILSKNEILADIPFIFLTAKTELSDVRRGMTLGADDYITKPFDDVELLDTIEMRLRKHKNHPTSTGASPSIINLSSGEQIIRALPEALLDGEPRLIRKKDLLFAEGQTCRYVFVIKSGRAIATKIDNYAKEVVTRLYQYPTIIGVASAFAGTKCQETVKAFEYLEVIPVKKDDFISYVLHDPSTAYYFLQQMASYQVQADEKLLLQAFGSVRMKLAATLVDLYAFYAENDSAVIPVAREDLASMAGTAKETIIRCLSEFKEEGLVSIQGSDIIIHAVQKLADLRY